MGYSASKAAFDTLTAMQERCIEETGMSNTYYFKLQKVFFEVGKEQPDGAITGTVKTCEGCHSKGSFRIEPDGAVTRFPGMPKYIKKWAADNAAAAKAFAAGAMFYIG